VNSGGVDGGEISSGSATSRLGETGLWVRSGLVGHSDGVVCRFDREGLLSYESLIMSGELSGSISLFPASA
jgi:hypothetical protein